MKAILFLFALVCTVAYAQNTVQLIDIDNFSEGIQSVVIILPANPSLPQIDEDFYNSPDGQASTNIIGGERDIFLQVTTGNQNNIISCQVDTTLQQFSVAVPQGASGFAQVQYDGPDGSNSLDTNGLSSSINDLTDGGQAIGIQVVLTTDIQTVYEFDFYDTNGNLCTRTVTIPPQPQGVFQDFNLPFTTFTTNCDWSDVGAIELIVNGDARVDTIIEYFGVYGTIPPSPSATRSPTRTPSKNPSQPPSKSRTRTPSKAPSDPPSQSRTRTVTRTPSPIPEPECNCFCPVFRCGLVYAVPGGDDDSSNDDSIYFPGYDDDIVYRPVYYHAIDDDFDEFVGDDDYDNISMKGGLVVNAWEREEDDEGIWYPDDAAARYLSSSDSSIVTLSITVLAAIAIAMAV